MKTKGKAWQLVVTVLLIAAFVYTAFFGVAVKYGDVTKTYIKGAQDIRFGVDIKGGVNVSDIWIDSLALSRIALPRLASHKLSFMADLFGCDSVSHRANADVDALCGVWRVLLVALTDLPSGLMARLADMHADVPWSYRPYFSFLAGQNPGSIFFAQRRSCRCAQGRSRRRSR